jgi:4-alpha-glucanotransferase
MARINGILFHPTSFPGRYGIGDLGKWAYDFVDWLVNADQSLWQVLPLGPTSYGDSPYQSPCAFAGNPNLISFDKLLERGYLLESDLSDLPAFPKYLVDFGWVTEYHQNKLRVAYQRFVERGQENEQADFTAYCESNQTWLDDYALFMSIKDANGGVTWTRWDNPDLVRYQADAVAQATITYAEDIDYYKFCQWVFNDQWLALKSYANENGIEMMGDLPIFVAHDSSDVWGNQHLFYLEEDGNPTVVAGVPPDYFSESGQRWGNPLYRWDVMEQDGYEWWKHRFESVLKFVDRVRVDHFRGFEAYWEIPATEPTAIIGEWVKGPGAKFFDVMHAKLGKLPIVAEDLGVITPEVEALRKHAAFPGMQVLQFAFDGNNCGSNTFLPHHHPVDTVVYTGTHDNNTAYGWWHSDEVNDGIRQCVAEYSGHSIDYLNHNIHAVLMRLAMSSVAETCVIPLQDVLGYGKITRFNVPGVLGGNWTWRIGEDVLRGNAHHLLSRLTALYSRGRSSAVERVIY